MLKRRLLRKAALALHFNKWSESRRTYREDDIYTHCLSQKTLFYAQTFSYFYWNANSETKIIKKITKVILKYYYLKQWYFLSAAHLAKFVSVELWVALGMTLDLVSTQTIYLYKITSQEQVLLLFWFTSVKYSDDNSTVSFPTLNLISFSLLILKEFHLFFRRWVWRRKCIFRKWLGLNTHNDPDSAR